MDQELAQIVRDFLNNHRKAIFAINDDAGLPTTSLMLYAIDNEFNVYFGTRRGFGKYQHILKNPTVSLSVMEEAIDPLKVADIRGVVTELTEEECTHAHTFFKTRNQSRYYVEGAEDFVMFKLTPQFIRWADASSGELKIVNLLA
jgi:uncharacterized pyridoxamine 5'-phosphate oxidase family protein